MRRAIASRGNASPKALLRPTNCFVEGIATPDALAGLVLYIDPAPCRWRAA